MPEPQRRASEELTGWTIVTAEEGVEDAAPGPTSPVPEAASRQSQEEVVCPAADKGCSSGDSAPLLDDEGGEKPVESGLASPESERLADNLLTRPFQSHASNQDLEGLEASMQVCMDAGTPSAVDAPEPHWHFDRNRMRAASRLSSEGALEGFQDPQDLPFAATPTGHTQMESSELEALDYGSGAILGWEGLWGAVWEDLAAEWGDICGAANGTAHALLARVHNGSEALQAWLAKTQRKAARALGGSCPLWALISLSSIAAMALAALAAQVLKNRDLAAQLRHRDKELARLIVKVLHLQDALHTAARSVPILRHTSFDRFGSSAVTIGMI